MALWTIVIVLYELRVWCAGLVRLPPCTRRSQTPPTASSSTRPKILPKKLMLGLRNRVCPNVGSERHLYPSRWVVHSFLEPTRLALSGQPAPNKSGEGTGKGFLDTVTDGAGAGAATDGAGAGAVTDGAGAGAVTDGAGAGAAVFGVASTCIPNFSPPHPSCKKRAKPFKK
eukprot:4455375-Amphidinium_carterae.1